MAMMTNAVTLMKPECGSNPSCELPPAVHSEKVTGSRPRFPEKQLARAMCPLKLPAVLLAMSLVLRCVTAVPRNRYWSVSREQTDARPESWPLQSGLLTAPPVSGPPRGPAGGSSHHMEKRRCNTATCVTQRLADFLLRSSNTIGAVYAPTNVGSSTYGKRDSLQRL
ncbi:hypothetical protein GN956_G22853 [Arapaima gigas]